MNQAISVRRAHILANGVPKEKLAKVLINYQNSSNLGIVRPLLNPEVATIVPEPDLTRDASHAQYQYQLGKGLTALGKALNVFLDDTNDLPKDAKEKLLLLTYDAGRLLTALFHNITQTRRNLVVPLLNKNVNKLVLQTAPGDFLFGESLGEKNQSSKKTRNRQ